MERRAAELRRQRELIDAELADLEQFLELGGRLAWLASWSGAPERPPRDAPPPVRHPGFGPAPGTDRTRARRQGHVIMDAVADVLRRAGRPLHVSEIHAGLAERGLALEGPSPVAALNTRLWKRAQAGRVVAQAGPEATYRLLEGEGG